MVDTGCWGTLTRGNRRDSDELCSSCVFWETIVLRQRTIHASMSDTPVKPPLPDRLSADPKSPFFDAEAFARDIGIRLNDNARNDVEEYCVSEGWIRVPVGKTRDRKGQPLTIKLKGKVEAYYRT